MYEQIFILYRNGQYYSWSVEKSALIETVERNPDFTVKDGDKIPSWRIAKYLLAS